MFTGIIEALGSIQKVEQKGQDLSLTISTGSLDLSDVNLGDSIAVNGVCLTVVALFDKGFRADVSFESLVHTRISDFKSGTTVNLEKALTLSTRLGGHLVSGHVDGIGSVVKRFKEGRSIRFQIACNPSIHKYIADKGSITIDGVSLTVTGLSDEGFALNIVPHTVTQTTIQTYQVGQKVHIEVDLMARYAERLLGFGSELKEPAASIDQTFLAEHGFLR